jgi:uncharacterized protein (TIGR01370 family)
MSKVRILRYAVLIALILAFCALVPVRADTIAEKWVVYYADKAPAEQFLPYDLIVFDSETHPPLRPLMHRGKVLLGYLSLGEAENYRPYFKKLQAKNLLLVPKKNWKGHYVVDIHNPAWSAMVIEELIPALLHQGFDGIMIDTMDSPLQLEADQPARYPGMKEAAVRLIKAIREHYPNITIMLNRGFKLLPSVEREIDMVLAESILARSDSETEAGEAYQRVADMLRQVQSRAPHVKVYTLDYWPPEDKAGMAAIYEAQRQQGFNPYVATPDLHSLIPEPQ